VVELAISTDDVLVGSLGDRFLERRNCSLELDQPLAGPALSGERGGAFVGDGGRLTDGPADPPDASRPRPAFSQVRGLSQVFTWALTCADAALFRSRPG
jgi:hypothetical protein